MGVHGDLEFFRPQHGDDEIHAERGRDDSEDETFHKIRSKFFAAARIKRERDEEHHCDSNIDGIKHNHFQKGGRAAMNATTPQFPSG
jgi:hypothetical protein